MNILIYNNHRKHVCCALAVLCLALPAGISAAAPGDLTLPRKSEETGADVVPPSRFPHWIHRVQYRCDACHNRLFEMKLGSTDITMEAIGKREFCGACHDGEHAFGVDFNSCNTCHTLPEE